MNMQFVGVIHEPTMEREALHRIEKLFVPGATLWVEHATLYPQIVRAAIHAGMSIKSLDSKLVRAFAEKYAGHPSMRKFIFYELRERSWKPKLRLCKENDLVVLFPTHAKRIIKQLGLPKSALKYIQSIPARFKKELLLPPPKKEALLFEANLQARRKAARGNKNELSKATWKLIFPEKMRKMPGKRASRRIKG